jgi:hypothetical protein
MPKAGRNAWEGEPDLKKGFLRGLHFPGFYGVKRDSGFSRKPGKMTEIFFGNNSITCFGEILFSCDDRPPCANPGPIGAGTQCDAPVLPRLEISRDCEQVGNIATGGCPSGGGMPACQKESQNYSKDFQRASLTEYSEINVTGEKGLNHPGEYGRETLSLFLVTRTFPAHSQPTQRIF